MLAAVKRVEVGDAIDTQDYGLAVEDEALLADLASRLDDPGIPIGPVIAAPGDQACAVAVALQAEAIAVVFDLV
jgi:hypothetical protein